MGEKPTFRILALPPAKLMPGISASTIKENKLSIRLLCLLSS